MIINPFLKHNLLFNIYQNRNSISLIYVCNNYYSTTNKIKTVKNSSDSVDYLINKYEDKILYNCTIEQNKVKLGYHRNKAYEEKQLKEYKQHLLSISKVQPLPVSLKYLNETINNNKSTKPVIEENIEQITQFPFDSFDKVNFSTNNIKNHETTEDVDSVEKEIKYRNTHYDENNVNWMTDYENYDEQAVDEWKFNYGTPDPYSAISNVPCGGCGALLHCKDTAIPGYIPSEIYKNYNQPGGQHLRTITCQRCHFLNNYNVALQVRVSPEDYPKILEKIQENKKALIILMIDLLDFPCSIWPNIMNIVGFKKPVIVVGNKVDLLPQDSKGYLERIKSILAAHIVKSGLNDIKLKHVALISAKTGYGIEDLITKLQTSWNYRGDVYLIGCTNVGKSTLFNALLQSDYCKIKAVDLVQRATTSMWPGTTLNLLKFPILKPSGWRLYVRTKRLMSLNKLESQENKLRKIQLRKTQNPKYASLIGNIERTFTSEEPVDEESTDLFSVQGHNNTSGNLKIGLNENDPNFLLSKWCYDTPGVVQPDQILNLLTTDELMLTLPKEIISPRTFSVQPGQTLFIAGLARLDVIEGPLFIRLTVFSSKSLPITVCATSDADQLYENIFGTELLKVPSGTEERLKMFPKLEAGEDIKLTGIDKEESCADIVLSNAGWISVTLRLDSTCILKAYTPEKRGIFVRESILSKAVTLRGRKIRFSPAYKKSKYF